MSSEEAYAEALRRIREAENTGASSLDLSYLDFLYQLPQELARLKSLQTLDLSGCDRLNDLSPLAGLTSLQTLNLSDCWQLTDLSPLAGLTSLQTLNLSGCEQLSGDLSPLAGLTSLQMLDLSLFQTLDLSWSQQFVDLSPLAGLTWLQRLYLSGCGQLSGDLTPLARLTGLHTLSLAECGRLRGDLGPLAGLASLRELNLSKCLGFRWFDPLRSLLPRLEKLVLFGCKFEDLAPAICGADPLDDVLTKVRAHFEDLQAGP